MSKENSYHNTLSFRGHTEMGEMILKHDWSTSKLGEIRNWPDTLTIALNNMLHSAFPMFLFWGDDFICFYNDAFRPSLGIDGKHPAIGKNGNEVWAEIWQFIGPLIQKVYTTGEPEWFEDHLVPFYRNGRVEDIYWTFCYSPAFGTHNQICGVMVTCMETTEKVLAKNNTDKLVRERTLQLAEVHDSLVQANTYLQRVINLFKEPLQILEPIVSDGKIIDFRFKLTNEAYSAYANTTPEALENKKVSEVFPGYLQTTSFINVAKTCQTGIPDTWEIHYDQDGLDLYNEMSATKLDNEVVVHFTDFTNLKHLQLELIRKIDELERSNRNLEEFAHAASHDLKEPIRKIKFFTSVLSTELENKLSENQSLLFSKIQNATERMSLLIEDLIQYSHVTNQPRQTDTIDLNQTLQQVLEDLELDIQQRNATIRLSILPHVKGYGRQLQQLFQNLISNSLKYSKHDVLAEISITSAVADEDGQRFNVIEVKDNGIGFGQQFADKIFEMFARLHGKNQYQGNGIGLSIVKKIVENHQGKITATSQQGDGATFKVYLPFE